MKYQGLTTNQVNERIHNNQVNVSNDNISKTHGQIIRQHTLTYFNALNLFLGILVVLSGQYKNLTFLGVVTFNTIIGIFQEFKVKELIDSVSIVTATKAKVIRNNELIEIPVDTLVIDDIVYLEAGDQISSDCTVLETHNLEINESLLTGESLPIEKNINDELLAGTFVVAGNGYAKVIRVGSENYSSKLVHKAKHQHRASSQMKDMIEKIIKIISIVIVPVGLLLFKSQMQANPDVSTAIVKTVGGVVGMIPEGLVLLTSLSFVLGVGRLAQKRALVQQMEAIEALSRVDVLCLDKTGTITTGDLEVREVVLCDDDPESLIHTVMGVIAHQSSDENATSKALENYFKNDETITILDSVPFSSARKYQAVTLSNDKSYVLGAPEFLLEEGHPVLSTMDYYLETGYRVLLLGECEDLVFDDVRALALIVISDVIKEDAADTFSFFKNENVSLCIISGDNPITVSRVCQMAGLEGAENYIDATTLPEDPEEMGKMIENCHIIGRVRPEQKQLIVKAYQNQGHIVGMVGDGVNDVLAIKDADCGIAMASGASAARQAAHIVLMDSTFSSMVDIVREGRTIIANIERVSALYLTKTIYSSIFSLFFGMLGLSYPFTPFQLSLIGSTAIGLPSFMITLEHDTKLSSEGFLSHIVHTAVPCALTIITSVLAALIFQQIFSLDDKMFTTISFIATGFVSFIVVYKVCRPLNILRGLLLFGGASVWFIGLCIFPKLLDMYSPFSNGIAWVFLILPITLVLVKVYTIAADYLFSFYKEGKP